MSNTIQCSPRFRLHTKLCLPAEEHKNPFLGLTSSSQEEVTRAMAVTSEGKASKAITSVRLPEERVWWIHVPLSAGALVVVQALVVRKRLLVSTELRMGCSTTRFCLYQLPVVSFYAPSWPCSHTEPKRKHDTQWTCVHEPGRTFKHCCSDRSFLSILSSTGKSFPLNSSESISC